MRYQIKPDDFAKLKRNHLMIGFLYAFFGLFIFIGSFTIQAVKNFKPDLFIDYITRVNLNTQYSPRYQITLSLDKLLRFIPILKDVPFMLIIGVMLLLAALIHILLVTKGANAIYNNRLQAGNVKSRLFESIVGSVLLPLLAIMIGISDASTIVMIFALGLGYSFLTHAMEQSNMNKTKTEWSSFIGMIIIFLFSAFSLGLAIYHQLGVQQKLLDNATILVPYLKNFNFIVIGIYFGFWLLHLVQVFLQHKKIKWWKNPVFVENTQIIYQFILKVAIVGIIFYGLINKLFTIYFENL